MIGAIDNTNLNFEHFGYLMEYFILLATAYNIATCWVGGTLQRNKFAKVMDTKANEFVPAITPLGFPSNRINVIDRIFKFVAKSKQRKPWEVLFFNTNNQGLVPEDSKKYKEALEMVRLAPSASNRQPWRVIQENDDTFHFFIFREQEITNRATRWLDFPRIDLGIAVCHFDLILKESRTKGTWKVENPAVYYPSNFQYLISWFGAQ